MKKTLVFSIIMGATLLLSFCRKAQPFADENYDERLSGGENTVFDNSARAYTHEFPGLSAYDAQIHELGDAAFEQSFVSAPAPVNSGLGPVFNNVSCISCHHNDGTGMPTAGDITSGLLVRISQPGMDVHGGAKAVDGYGTQLQDKAIFGKRAECKINISYTYASRKFADGEDYELRIPSYTISDLYSPILTSYMLSPRMAPPVFGLGLLEAIAEADILANADENDANGDGISGKANYVWDPISESMQIGKFGLKANTANLLTQVAAAYNNDMGITSYVFKNETSHGQSQSDNYKDDPELPDSILKAVKFYVQTLSVPARRNVDAPEVIHGKKLFYEAQCNACHKPTFITPVNVALRNLSNQRIHPYTDMLVHDMGDSLADNRPDFKADGKEWRTSPLWGIGLRNKANYPGFYLHDGRARSLTEAIMWHGGEAQKSKIYFSRLSKKDRDDLLEFLKSL